MATAASLLPKTGERCQKEQTHYSANTQRDYRHNFPARAKQEVT
jgi:hypothetical protein